MNAPCAFAIIETPTTYVLEGPPNDGSDPYLWRMFGGSIEVTDATAKDAARRELDEELGLDVADEDVEEVWHGLDSQSRTRHGLETSRLVSLFRVMIGSTGDLTLREGGSIIEIAKDLDVLRRHESSMTALTYLALSGKLEAEKAA